MQPEFIAMNVVGILVAPIVVGMWIQPWSKVALYSALCGIATPVALAIFNLSLFPYDGNAQAMLNYITWSPSDRIVSWISRTAMRGIIASGVGSCAYWIKSSARAVAGEPALRSRWRKLRVVRIILFIAALCLVLADALSHQFLKTTSGGAFGQVGVLTLLAAIVIGLIERNTRKRIGAKVAGHSSASPTEHATTDR